MCVHYRTLDSLVPPDTKAHLKAKGVLTLVPLPKINEICVRINDSCIYSTFDMRSGYHYIELSKEYQPKSVFVTPMGKFEFTHVPFGLEQTPASFQRLVNEVLMGLDFAFEI